MGLNELRAITDNLVASLTDKERSILDARRARYETTIHGRLVALSSAFHNGTLVSIVSAKDRGMIRRHLAPMVRNLKQRSKNMRKDFDRMRKWGWNL